MTARYVRNTVRTWCEETAIAMSVPFYDTINRHTEPTDNTWWTVEFFSRTHNNKTYCQSGYNEEGDIDFVFCATPGMGDNELLLAIENVMAEFSPKFDPSSLLTIEGYDPVAEVLLGSADRWYRLAVGARYRFIVI